MESAFEYFTTISICICSQFALKLAFYATDTLRFREYTLLRNGWMREQRICIHILTIIIHFQMRLCAPFFRVFHCCCFCCCVSSMCYSTVFFCCSALVVREIGCVFFTARFLARFNFRAHAIFPIDKKCIQIATANINRCPFLFFVWYFMCEREGGRQSEKERANDYGNSRSCVIWIWKRKIVKMWWLEESECARERRTKQKKEALRMS